MKTILTTILLLGFTAPYVVGKIQFNNAVNVIQNLSFEEDGEIEDVLNVFYFPTLDASNDNPTFIELYKSGITTICNSINL